MDQFDLLERRLKLEIDTDAPFAKKHKTGIETEDALIQLSAYQPGSAQGQRLKLRFLLTKLVNRYPEVQDSAIVNALFAMGDEDATFGTELISKYDRLSIN